jgi:hypothetical protein
MADRVYAAVQPVKPSRPYALDDHRIAYAKRSQLGTRDHAMLPGGKHRESDLDGVRVDFLAYA